jgi:O-antigen/teichoic acid export membrane protein
MSSVKRRLLAGFGANTYGRALQTVIQIVSVPVFLSHWGAFLYGEWLLLNAIPSYFLMSDIGFGTVAGNEMTMLVAAGKHEEALAVFQSVWVFVTGISALCLLIVLGSVAFLPLDRWFHLHALTPVQARFIIIWLCMSVLLGMQETLFQAAFRCVGQYAFGTAAKSTAIFVGFLALMVAVLFNQAPERAAFIYMLVNWTATFVLWILLRRKIPWLRFGVKHARFTTIRRLASPSISFLFFPLGNALNLQGILMVIGHVTGPIGVVTFSTARTISRSAYQAMQLINNSVWPEMSAAFGKGDMNLARTLHRRSCQVSLLLCIITVFGVALLGDHVWKIWTVGKVAADPVLLDLLLLQMLVAAFWFTSAVVATSSNRHQSIALMILATTVLSLALSWWLLRIPWLQLRGVALSLILGDLIMAAVVLKQSLEILNDTWGGFLGSMLSVPQQFQILRRRTVER